MGAPIGSWHSGGLHLSLQAQKGPVFQDVALLAKAPMLNRLSATGSNGRW